MSTTSPLQAHLEALRAIPAGDKQLTPAQSQQIIQAVLAIITMLLGGGGTPAPPPVSTDAQVEAYLGLQNCLQAAGHLARCAAMGAACLPPNPITPK